MTSVIEKQRAHELIERFPPEQTPTVVGMLQFLLLDPVARAVAAAPPDDEPVTDEERRRLREGQAQFERGGGIPMEDVLAKDIADGRPMGLDWSQCPAVESVPGKVSGAWVFKDTRMPVSAVFENLEDGVGIDELVELYDGLTREQVEAVLDFAARTTGDIDPRVQ
jgi:uncharacterized protein (DUF433 family)